MNVPLSWLKQYVNLPKTEKELTERLTLIGHMLDKRHAVNDDVVLDLELRGNRSDLFGIYGIARDISAAWNTPLAHIEHHPLPPTDPKTPLFEVQANDLVERFTAITLDVQVKESPSWLKTYLELYGIASINNVVDITNYVMIETGEPMHAYDLDTLVGKKLIIRRAKKDEKFVTLQGTELVFSNEDLVICDEKEVHGTAIIGGRKSGVSESTTRILLEAAVYNQANVRRTARRLKVRTEAGNRHEKLLDPNQVPMALSRALHFLIKEANAKVTSKTSDQIIKKRTAQNITVHLSILEKQSGLSITGKTASDILKNLGCEVTADKETLQVKAPTFRTDIEQEADLIEEIVRIVGYNHIPSLQLTGNTPYPQRAETVPSKDQYTQLARPQLEEIVRNAMTHMGYNEVITISLLPNQWIEKNMFAFEIIPPHGGKPVVITNPPDPDRATLRPSLIPGIVDYTTRQLQRGRNRAAFFEIGKRFLFEDKTYKEISTLTCLLSGSDATWRNMKGVVEQLFAQLGVSSTTFVNTHTLYHCLQSLDQAEIKHEAERIGIMGELKTTITRSIDPNIQKRMFLVELDIDTLLSHSKQTYPYELLPMFPPLIDDMAFTAGEKTRIGIFIDTIQNLHPYVRHVRLLDVHENKRTIRVQYANNEKTLSREDTKSIRQNIIDKASEFGLSFIENTTRE